MKLNRKILPYLALLIISLINALFVLKYTIDLPGKPIYYGVLYLFLIIALIKLSELILYRYRTKWLFHALAVLSIFAMFVILQKVDPNNTQPDRWSAIHNFNIKLLQGEFPYNAITHTGQKASGMPFLFVLVLPFQLLGDVGFFQLFAFIVFILTIQSLFIQQEQKLFILLILISSPLFWWEVYVRSDLASNLFLFTSFLLLCEKYRNTKAIKHMLLLGILLGLFGSTRGILIIPFLVYFITYFKKSETKPAFVLLSSALVIFILTILPFYIWNSEDLIQNNPLLLQTDKSPKAFMIIAILLSIAGGLFAKDFYRANLYSGLILFALMFTNLIFSINEWGWKTMLYEDKMDISYLSMTVPFLIYSVYTLFPIKKSKVNS